MVYILEEYLLAGLVGAGLNELVTIIEDCYLEAEQMEKE